MNTRDITPPPPDREVIVVETETQLVRHSYVDPGPDLLRSPGTWTVSDETQGSDLLRDLAVKGLLRPGQILVQSPFDPSTYFRAGDARVNASEEKHFIFTELCRLLGATRVTQEIVERHEDKSVQKLSAEAGKGTFKLKLSGQDEAETRLASRIALDDKYAGHPADIQAAMTLLQKHGLLSDPFLMSCLDARSGGNELTSRTWTVELSQEVEHKLALAARLVVAKLLTVDANGSAQWLSKKSYRAHYSVTFASQTHAQ